MDTKETVYEDTSEPMVSAPSRKPPKVSGLIPPGSFLHRILYPSAEPQVPAAKAKAAPVAPIASDGKQVAVPATLLKAATDAHAAIAAHVAGQAPATLDEPEGES